LTLVNTKRESAFLYNFNFKGSFLSDNFQVIDRGGIIETTVDHSDIRGLAIAFHIFVVELPLSNLGN
jgi:hypothetical protein